MTRCRLLFALLPGIQSATLVSEKLPWFEDWNRRAEEELQAALDAEATIRREHEAAAQRVSQLLNKADEAESALKKAAAGVDWKVGLPLGPPWVETALPADVRRRDSVMASCLIFGSR